MKYLVGAALVFVALLLFLPYTGSTEIRNLPLLILILTVVFVLIMIRFLKYVILTAKTKRILKKYGVTRMKVRFLPWASRFHGHYSIVFSYEGKPVQILLLSRKIRYQRYHFDSPERLEFYRANRVAFKTGKERATVSNLVEVKRVGKQRIKWDAAASTRMVLFDRLPSQITDSVKKEHLAAGDPVCASDTLIADQAFLQKLLGKTVSPEGKK